MKKGNRPYSRITSWGIEIPEHMSVRRVKYELSFIPAFIVLVGLLGLWRPLLPALDFSVQIGNYMNVGLIALTAGFAFLWFQTWKPSLFIILLLAFGVLLSVTSLLMYATRFVIEQLYLSQATGIPLLLIGWGLILFVGIIGFPIKDKDK